MQTTPIVIRNVHGLEEFVFLPVRYGRVDKDDRLAHRARRHCTSNRVAGPTDQSKAGKTQTESELLPALNRHSNTRDLQARPLDQ